MQVFKRRAAGIAVAVFFLAGWQGQALAQATASAAAGTSHSLDDTYRSHIEFLANPFMEGRGPGTRGNEIASEYIESWYTTIGLKPELPWTGRGSPGHPTNGPREPASGSDPGVQPAADSLERRSFRQEFTAGSRAQLESGWLDDTSLAAKDVVFKLGADYSVLGFSGDAKVELPLAFVGYSIESGGPDKAYSSYSSANGETPLAGRIAVMFRFEPMNASGESLWRKKEDTLWTPASAIADKIGAAIKRGAAGILLVNPPGCSDARATKLESTEGSARWTQRQDIPIFMTTAPAAERLLKAHDSEGRTILRWRQLADSQGGVVLLDDKPVKMEAKIDRSPRTTWNIAGVLPGRGPLASQYVVIGAHYDHVGYGYTGGSRSDEYGIVHPG
ncbi:MAG TPA: hypothetical protein VHC70_06620, partial [Phycisphaerales bacterium]|nr:hypothetical protein [Phycisphaerales bacterium]